MKLLLFGAGNLYQEMKHELKSFHILAIIDNDKKKHGQMLDGHLIISPKTANDYEFDYIVLTNSYKKDTKRQLIELGIDEKKIANDINALFLEKLHVRKVKKYRSLKSNLQNSAKRVLLIAHDLGEGGAQGLLFNMAKWFIMKGFYVELFAIGRETILHEFLKIGVQISIYDQFDFTDEEMEDFKNKYDLVVANTLLVYDVVLKFFKNIPILWWIHEADIYFEKCQIKRETFNVLKKINIFAEGERVQKSFYKYAGYEIPVLRYGIPSEYSKPVHHRLTFALIGYEEYRKGMDIYISAVEKNENKWDDDYRFLIIGNTPEIQKKYSRCEKIQFLGELSHDTINTLYGEIDVLVCPSRDDPQPVVITEAMMQKKCCIISDQTGQATLIKNYREGRICKAGDVDSLAGCIQWVIDHEDARKEIGENAFEVYKKFFSTETFYRRLNEIVTEIVQ